MRRLVLLVAAASLAPAAAAGAVDAPVFFQTPSHHIGCAYSTLDGEKPTLRCDVTGIKHLAKRPPTCDQDYGMAFGLTERGHARRLCVGDTVMDPKAKILKYGHSRTLGPFRCTSRTSGLRCTNAAGHGFELSRQRQRLF